MKVFVKGDPEVTLTKRNYVAGGGEGDVYALGDTGYKIYHDHRKAIPMGKIHDLSVINHPCVIKPEAALFQNKRQIATHVGHTFRFVKDTWTMCQLFPRAFRERERFDHTLAVGLVQNIQEGVAAVHSAGVLLVDLNEMNFLVSQNFKEPYFIDVDSYQTKHFPATAIMPSVRDPLVQGNNFSTNSDWFSFAIVTFQIFVGIHPFKGKHPSIKGMENRMAAGISVFDDAVKLPKVVYSLDVIPEAYRAWYKAIFVDGKRMPPPADLHGAVIVHTTVRQISGTDNFEITEVHDFGEDIRTLFVGGDHMVVVAGSELFVDKRLVGPWETGSSVGFTPQYGNPIVAKRTKGVLTLMDTVTRQPLKVDLNASALMVSGDTLYIQNRDQILEVVLKETPNATIVGTRRSASVIEHASKLFDGVVIQNLLGEPHVSLFPRSGASYQMLMDELKGHGIVQAKFDKGVLMVLATKDGNYHRFVFRFDHDYSSYDCRKVEDVDPVDLNFVTLDKGICVCLNEAERLEIFSNQMRSSSMKTIEDPILGGDMRLVKHEGSLMFHRGSKLYKMRMK